MTPNSISQYGFLTDYVHLTFLAGIVLGYLYFRRSRVSVGGTLAVGYLASSLYAPLNVVATIGVSVLAFLLIRLVILKIFLPRPRQIFAIGLTVGVVLGGAWLALGSVYFPDAVDFSGLQLVGVIVPGMLCNSLVKQGVRKTMVPLAVMVPAAAVLGLAVAFVTSKVLFLSVSDVLFTAEDDTNQVATFILSAVSVLMAVLIQESTVRSLKLRTAGYVTAGILASSFSHPAVIVVVLAVVALLAAVWIPYSSRIPLFGKDRFFILLMLSFFLSTVAELVLHGTTGAQFNGPQNVVVAVLPAIIVNDLVQYGPKRTAAGFGISAASCAAVATGIALVG